jgi:hypothetical protein
VRQVGAEATDTRTQNKAHGCKMSEEMMKHWVICCV